MSAEVDASKFPPLSICGIGDVRGLLGANCRHSIGPGDGRFKINGQRRSASHRNVCIESGQKH